MCLNPALAIIHIIRCLAVCAPLPLMVNRETAPETSGRDGHSSKCNEGDRLGPRLLRSATRSSSPDAPRTLRPPLPQAELERAVSPASGCDRCPFKTSWSARGSGAGGCLGPAEGPAQVHGRGGTGGPLWGVQPIGNRLYDRAVR